jgi:hypothetical protein
VFSSAVHGDPSTPLFRELRAQGHRAVSLGRTQNDTQGWAMNGSANGILNLILGGRDVQATTCTAPRRWTASGSACGGSCACRTVASRTSSRYRDGNPVNQGL